MRQKKQTRVYFIVLAKIQKNTLKPEICLLEQVFDGKIMKEQGGK